MKIGLIIRRVILALWAVALIAGAVFYVARPEWFSSEHIAAFLHTFGGRIMVVYLALSVLRGFTVIPSTPFVLAGTVLFPGQPVAVLAISIAGILLSSSMIYFFSEFLGLSEYFESHKPALTHKIKSRMEHPLGFVFVALWAFFPLVPTDLVCYIAGTAKMNFWKFIGAVFVGELVLCSGYIFFGRTVLDYVR